MLPPPPPPPSPLPLLCPVTNRLAVLFILPPPLPLLPLSPLSPLSPSSPSSVQLQIALQCYLFYPPLPLLPLLCPVTNRLAVLFILPSSPPPPPPLSSYKSPCSVIYFTPLSPSSPSSVQLQIALQCYLFYPPLPLLPLLCPVTNRLAVLFILPPSPPPPPPLSSYKSPCSVIYFTLLSPSSPSSVQLQIALQCYLFYPPLPLLPLLCPVTNRLAVLFILPPSPPPPPPLSSYKSPCSVIYFQHSRYNTRPLCLCLLGCVKT